MKTAYFFLAAAMAVTALTSCDMKTKTYPWEYRSPEQANTADSTIFGRCGNGSTAKRLQLITDTEDTLFFNVEKAQKQFGYLAGFSRGDEVYVLPDSSRTVALMVINKDRLLGEWVMPSPYDGSTPSGVRLKDGGEAESIEQQGDLRYKAWRIYNGQLVLTETREYDEDNFVSQTYDIKRMSHDPSGNKPDSLYIANAEESFEFTRLREEKIDAGLKFEEDEFDFMGQMFGVQ